MLGPLGTGKGNLSSFIIGQPPLFKGTDERAGFFGEYAGPIAPNRGRLIQGRPQDVKTLIKFGRVTDEQAGNH